MSAWSAERPLVFTHALSHPLCPSAGWKSDTSLFLWLLLNIRMFSHMSGLTRSSMYFPLQRRCSCFSTEDEVRDSQQSKQVDMREGMALGMKCHFPSFCLLSCPFHLDHGIHYLCIESTFLNTTKP